MAWLFAAVQLFGTTMVYCQPIFESFDAAYGNIYVSSCLAAFCCVILSVMLQLNSYLLTPIAIQLQLFQLYIWLQLRAFHGGFAEYPQ